jgi:shikimate kinase
MNGIVLIGFMGAGKSSIGRALARRTRLSFIDTDKRIEEEAGCTISELFAREGEAAFRQREADLLARLAGDTPSIVATGGGIITQAGNWHLLRRLGTIVYLRASADVLFDRVRRHSHRPLLQGDNPRATFDALFAARKVLYEQADITVDTDGMRPGDVAELLIERLQVPR